MGLSLVFCAIVLVTIERADCTLGDFLNNLPSEIGNAFHNVWNSIMVAIRHPVRIKRLGKTRATTTRSTTPMTTEPIHKLVASPSTKNILKLLQAGPSTVKYNLVQLNPAINRLMLPVLTTPKWQNLEQWKKLQKPTFMWIKQARGTTTPEDEYNEVGVDQEPSKLTDEGTLGVLMYVKK